MSEHNGWESVNVYRLNLEIDKTTKIPKEAAVHKPDDARDIVNLVLDLNNSAVEKFGFIALDKNNKVIGIQVLAVGKGNTVAVDDPMLVKAIYMSFAEAIILFHNHPSGDVRPSLGDLIRTKEFINLGVTISIPVYDHIIVGHENYRSMHENKDCEFKKPRDRIYLSEFFE